MAFELLKQLTAAEPKDTCRNLFKLKIVFKRLHFVHFIDTVLQNLFGQICRQNCLKCELISIHSAHLFTSEVPLQLWLLIYVNQQPRFVFMNYWNPGKDQAVLKGSIGCNTYMGVLSLQGWRGKVIMWIFESTTHCGTLSTHPNHRTTISSEGNRPEHAEECHYHAQLNTVSSKHMFAEHVLGRFRVIDKA